MMARFFLLVCFCFAMAAPARAQTPAKELFGAMKQASTQSAAAHGSYAKGCLAGAEQLPESGPTWQAMRLSRNRNWGHPEMIAFIKRLVQKSGAPKRLGRAICWRHCTTTRRANADGSCKPPTGVRY